ncbi:MAG: replication-associated recombination protein A [Patescibacteria group bacterium]
MAPLAQRMRPITIDEIVGQDHLLGSNGVLRSLIESDHIPSMILWGPPGVGKTTIAQAIATTTGAHFVQVSAVQTGVKEAREIIAKAKDAIKFHKKRTILFVDEIHRFNKAQQDACLPSVEDGTIILIGATTENPSFEVNSALLSRTRVLTLKAHTVESLNMILDRALSDTQKGLGNKTLTVDDESRDVLLQYSNGDGRTLLNALELVTSLVKDNTTITKTDIETALQHKALQYDKGGEEHCNIISAFIKSMRNSDVNAALYWCARMIEAGEDPLFIARRMVVFASEDIGLADVHALPIANAVFQAIHTIGMPEGRINLAHGVVYLAQAPKNNTAYRAMEAALADAKEYGNLPVPLHLRNAPTKLMKELEYGKGYQYAHDIEEKVADMECMPDELIGRKYFGE